MKKKINDKLEDAYVKSKSHQFKAEDWITEDWEMIKGKSVQEAQETGISEAKLKDIGNKITVLPKEMNFHRLVRKIFETRTASIESGKAIDWGTAEALAFASLLTDGYHVRISG